MSILKRIKTDLYDTTKNKIIRISYFVNWKRIDIYKYKGSNFQGMGGRYFAEICAPMHVELIYKKIWDICEKPTVGIGNTVICQYW